VGLLLGVGEAMGERPLEGDQATCAYRNLIAGWDDSTHHSGLQIHPPQQVMEARVVAEGVVDGPYICPHDT